AHRTARSARRRRAGVESRALPSGIHRRHWSAYVGPVRGVDVHVHRVLSPEAAGLEACPEAPRHRIHAAGPDGRSCQAACASRNPPPAEAAARTAAHVAVNVAMLTTAGERCGIAAYSAALVAALRTRPDTQVHVVPILAGEQPSAHYEAQAAQLNALKADVVHIQHEFSFWGFPT